MFLQLFVAIFLPFFAALVHTLCGPVIVDKIGLPRLQKLQHRKPEANGRFGFWQDDSLMRIFFSLVVVIPHSVFALLVFLSYSIRRPFNITFADACLYSFVEILGVVVVNQLLPYLLVYICNDWSGRETIRKRRKTKRNVKMKRKSKKRKLLISSKFPPLPVKYTAT